MELADNGDVFQKIVNHKKQKTYIKERQIWQIFIQTVRGLQAMHKIKVMHRDLKSAKTGIGGIPRLRRIRLDKKQYSSYKLQERHGIWKLSQSSINQHEKATYENLTQESARQGRIAADWNENPRLNQPMDASKKR